jgi:hypothetical protein
MKRFSVRFIENPKTRRNKKHRIELLVNLKQKISFTHEEACEVGEALLASARYWDSLRQKGKS